MPPARPPAGSTLLLDEAFEGGDERFLRELFASKASAKLGAFAERWYKDARPFARAALLRYVDDGCDRPRHRPLVKRLFKLAEAAGDDEALGHFMVAFDRMVVRRIERVERYDWAAREVVPAFVLRRDRSVTEWAGHTDQTERFSRRTRLYLCRRAFRYFRALGYRDPARYGRAIRAALRLYRDEHLERPEQLLDAWGLMHSLYWGSTVLSRLRDGIQLADGGALAELRPAPIHPEAWESVLDEVLALVDGAEARTVRVWAIAWLRARYAEGLRGLPIRRVVRLLCSKHDEVQSFGAGLLRDAKGIEGLSLAEWLELLRIENLDVLPLVCELVAKNVSPKRLTLAQCVELGCAKAAPVAELGLAWAKEKPVETAEALAQVVALGGAGAPRVREVAVEWVAGLLARSRHARPEHARELLDAPHADARARGLALLEGEGRFRDETSLWAALAESPYDDARAFLVKHLEARQRALEPGVLRHVWASSLLAVHRGGKAKRAAVAQIAERVVRRPGEAEALLPLLGIALRSVRPPDRRAALAALARAAFASPSLGAAIERRLPELKLSPEHAA